MKIKLHFPTEGIDKIKALGLRQTNPETLRLVTQHLASSDGIGVILRGKSGEVLDGQAFFVLNKTFGAWIECDTLETQRRVQKVLLTGTTELDDAIKIMADTK